jgi:large subunit ribosomal protein L19
MTAKTKPAKAPIKIVSNSASKLKNFDMKVGDTVKVHLKIKEKGKTRIQIFEGMVLARKHGSEAGATFTVRKNANGYGVERIFPIHSPMIDKVEVTKRAKVRRAKLYYIRDKAAKEISKRMKMEMMRSDSKNSSSDDEIEAANAPVVEEVEEVVEDTAEETDTTDSTDTPDAVDADGSASSAE